MADLKARQGYYALYRRIMMKAGALSCVVAGSAIALLVLGSATCSAHARHWHQGASMHAQRGQAFLCCNPYRYSAVTRTWFAPVICRD
jgi:hypothetical protein